MAAFGLNLPEYPWEALAPYRELAAKYPTGVADLSIGTPVDPTPASVQRALQEASDAPGYPTTHGTAALREAIANWYVARRGTSELNPADILPVVGSKEFVAWLPTLLGLTADDVVMFPKIAYPTYAIGAQIAGVSAVAADSLDELPADVAARVKLIWVNSPSNPTGEVLNTSELAHLVNQARELGALIASDECYAELGWGEWDVQEGGRAVPSILDPEVSQGSFANLLSVYSLSKQSNLAGYRAAFVAGDHELIAPLLSARKHAGMIVPAPIQAAMIAALEDTEAVDTQKAVYRARREVLKPALEAAGFQIEDSQAGLYLWASRGQDTWESIKALAEQGIVAGPGVFYGDAGAGYVRVALTATDEQIAAAAKRLYQMG